MPAFRNGQWVSFTTPVEDAHSANGRHVGIHMDGMIHPVSARGENLPGPEGALKLPLGRCGEVLPLLDKEHIPEARRVSLHPDFVLKP